MTRSRSAALLAAALVGVLALSACSSGDSGTPTPSGSGCTAATNNAETIGHDACGVTVEGGFGEKPKITIGADTMNVTQLQVVDLVEGTGQPVEPGAAVLADYAGWGAMTMSSFDSSFDRGQPTAFSLDGVIKGWTLGIVGMKKGGRRLLVIPASLAYADSPPAGSGIQVNEPLIFVVDLVDYRNPTTSPSPSSS